MWATRYRIAHGYANVSMATIAATVSEDVPKFRDDLERALQVSINEQDG